MYSKDEAKQLRKNFWDDFGYYSRRLPELKGQNKKWMLYNTKIKHVELKFEVERKHIQVILEVNHRSETQRLDVFGQLEQYKSIIEEIYGGSLIWDFVYTLPENKDVCRIYCETTEYDFHKQEQWPAIFRYLSTNMLRLEEAFVEIKDLIRLPESF